MIKNSILLLMSLFLSSCNQISYSQVIPLVDRAVFGVKDITVDDNFLSQKKYSFIKVNVGRTGVAILTLASIEDGVYTWVSATGEKLKTYNGKIIKSFDTAYDTHFLSYSNFSINKNINIAEYDYTLKLYNPISFVTQVATLKIGDSTGLEGDQIYFEEFVTTKGFKWKFVNKYWLNNDGNTVKSIQYLHPLLPKYEINFYYK
jgi:hypothetical protein